jgi:AdoMet-dependent heme synthase
VTPSTLSLELPSGTPTPAPGDAIPHVVAWNLTRRCNLACAHCYISAGSWHAEAEELSTDRCLRIVDEILAVNPAPMLILSGGEPLLRTDLETLARHATEGGATVVVGTNGTRLTDARIASLMEAGVQGVAVSVDSLRPQYHDRFRHGNGALSDTMAAVERLGRHGLDFIVQASLTRGNRAELPGLVAWSAEMGAVAFNLYFLVPTGRGEAMAGLAPHENEEVLEELLTLEARYRGRMMVRSKCQPQLMRLAHAGDPASPLLNYATRCPCGVQYCRITPEGKITPCPYTPAVAGDLMAQPFGTIWRESPVFQALREGTLGGKCGRCAYREVCGGCRARAYALESDLMAADPACAYEPDGMEPAVPPRTDARYGAPPPAPGLPWTDGARARVARIPSFVRGVVVERVERFAREAGAEQVDEALMARVRREMPVDFSKRLPFFLRRGGEA